MFERFTTSARRTVVSAQQEAHRLGHRHIGSEHLLLALTLAPEDDPARSTLAEFGLDHAAVDSQLLRLTGGEQLDASALESVGIDLEEVRRRVEAQFGEGALEEAVPSSRRRGRGRNVGGGHIPFTDDAKRTLELGLREAVALQSREIGSSHLLLGLLGSGSGLGWRIVQTTGVETGLIRTRLGQRMRSSV